MLVWCVFFDWPFSERLSGLVFAQMLTNIDGSALLRIDGYLGEGFIEKIRRGGRSVQGLQVRLAGTDQLSGSGVELVQNVLQRSK